MPYESEAQSKAEADKPLELSDYNKERLRNFFLDSLATQGSPAEWAIQQFVPGYQSGNKAGIYASEPDIPGMAMNFAGGIGGGKGPKGPGRAVESAFFIPETGGVVHTGPFHDITKLDPYYQQFPDRAVSGFADDSRFWTKDQASQMATDPKAAGPGYPFTLKEPTGPANEMLPPGEIIGLVDPVGGYHNPLNRHDPDLARMQASFSDMGKFFKRPSIADNLEMPTSGLPDDPAMFSKDGPGAAQDIPEDTLKAILDNLMSTGKATRYERFPYPANEPMFPPTPPIPIGRGKKKK